MEGVGWGFHPNRLSSGLDSAVSASASSASTDLGFGLWCDLSGAEGNASSSSLSVLGSADVPVVSAYPHSASTLRSTVSCWFIARRKFASVLDAMLFGCITVYCSLCVARQS